MSPDRLDAIEHLATTNAHGRWAIRVIPALIAEVRRLREENADLRAASVSP